MKCKKLITMALAGAMTLSMAVPSMAAGTETKISGSYQPITIDVILMPTGKAQINPYGMPVKAYDTGATPAIIQNSGADMTLNTAGKIATQPLVMYNKTTSELNVGATVSAANVTGLELVTTNIAASATDKQAQIYLETKQDMTLVNGDVGTGTNVATKVAGVDGVKVVNAFNSWATTTYDKTNPSQVLVNPDEPTTKKGIATLAAATSTGVSSGGFVLYRLGGNCTEEPETPWSTSDKFDINVAFSFTPIKAVATADSGTIALESASIAATDTTTATYTAPTGVTLSRNAVYTWSFTGTNAAAFSISAGQGTSNVTIATSGSTGNTANVKLVIMDGNTKYEPAVQAITVS